LAFASPPRLGFRGQLSALQMYLAREQVDTAGLAPPEDSNLTARQSGTACQRSIRGQSPLAL
jgi:hypothetical protein